MSAAVENCIVMRRQGETLSTIGPRAKPESFASATDRAIALRRQYPHQEFMVLEMVAEAQSLQTVTIKNLRPRAKTADICHIPANKARK